MLWAGRIMSGLPALFLLMDGVMRLVKLEPVVKATVQLEYSESVILGLGIVLLVCVILYLIPRTSVLGAIRVRCETQDEIDYYWEKLSAGGEKGRCGWLKYKFGVSWQIVPPVLGEMLNDEDDAKSERVTQAMLQMDKIEIEKLKEAYERQ
jgi:3-demethylubiquinone-9 3-methyltransferase/DoxX-like family